MEIIDLLLNNYEIDVNARDENGYTALIVASSSKCNMATESKYNAHNSTDL